MTPCGRTVPDMVYLIVGLDRSTLAPWHRNVGARDVSHAKHLARARASADGIDLAVAAVIGAASDVLSDAASA
jgi:hypothetical protein